MRRAPPFLLPLHHRFALLWSRTMCSRPAAAEGGPVQRYTELCASGHMVRDDHQVSALYKLERLHVQLLNGWKPAPLAEDVMEEEDETPGMVERLDQVFASAFGYNLAVGGGSDRPAGASGVRVSRFGSDYDYDSDLDARAGAGGFLRGLFARDAGGNGSNEACHDMDSVAKAQMEASAILSTLPYAPKGCYLHGGVGTGKTFMMDLFFEVAPVPGAEKQRLNYHEFMLRVHSALHQARYEAGGAAATTAASDAASASIRAVARDIIADGWLLCFDEFQVTDVADALVLKSLLAALFEHGAVIVATSNRTPDELYKNGVQRHLFAPCVPLIEGRLEVHEIGADAQDYRSVQLQSTGDGGTLFCPGSEASAASSDTLSAFEQAWAGVTLGATVQEHTISAVGGGSRTLVASRAVVLPAKSGAGKTRAARFTFDELCGNPLSAADFISLASTFSTIALECVPHLKLRADANQVRRFIQLVDTLYDKRVVLLLHSAAHPTELFMPPDQCEAEDKDIDYGDLLGTAELVIKEHDELFSHTRCVSRLLEMASKGYLRRARSWHAQLQHVKECA